MKFFECNRRREQEQDSSAIASTSKVFLAEIVSITEDPTAIPHRGFYQISWLKPNEN